jgi:hypothetical protein
VAWYRSHVYNDYRKSTVAIYDEIDRIQAAGYSADQESQLVGAQYDKLRNLNNSLEPMNIQGTRYPTPEAFAFYQRAPDVQQTYRERWAALPPQWLSSFQFETVYGGNVDKGDQKYLGWESQIQDYFDQHTKGISHSSNEYDAWVKWRETNDTALARRTGSMDIRRLENHPPIYRLQQAGLLPENPSMNYIVKTATDISQKLSARGLSPWGTSADAEWYRGQLEGQIELMRDPNSQYYNRAVDLYWSRQAHVTGITNHQTLYRSVIWGLSNSFELPLDYSAENALARRVSGQ